MIVRLNGKETEVADEATVQMVLDTMGVDPERVVVEMNGRIPDRSAYESITLSQGDVIEVVRFVGGG